MSRFIGIILISSFFLCGITGCKSELDDPLYMKAKTYQEAEFELTKSAIDSETYTAERSAEIRNESAQKAGFASTDEMQKQLASYTDSGDPDQKEIAKKIIDLAMEYNNKIDEYIQRKEKEKMRKRNQ